MDFAWITIFFVGIYSNWPVSAQRDQGLHECVQQGLNVTSGNPAKPSDFEYTAGQDVRITLTLNCPEPLRQDPWLFGLSFLSVFFLPSDPTMNSTKKIDLFEITSRMGNIEVTSIKEIPDYGIQVKPVLQRDQRNVSVVIVIPQIQIEFNGSMLSWSNRRSRGGIGPIIVKCCVLQDIPTSFKAADKHTVQRQLCFHDVSVNCKRGTMFKNTSYVPHAMLQCNTNSQWKPNPNLKCIDAVTLDFSKKNQVLNYKSRVVFVCKAGIHQTAVLMIGNVTNARENGTAWSKLIMTPHHNGMEAKCRSVNGNGTTVNETKIKLNVKFPPMPGKGILSNYSLTEGESGRVIIKLLANPPLAENGGLQLIKDGEQELTNFYVMLEPPDLKSTHMVVIDFIQVKESDFGYYTLFAKSRRFREQLFINFTIVNGQPDPASKGQQSEAPEGSYVAAIFLAAALAVCLVALFVLGILYAKKKAVIDKGASQKKTSTPENAGVYNEPDFGDYENLEVADRPTSDFNQQGEYVNARL